MAVTRAGAAPDGESTGLSGVGCGGAGVHLGEGAHLGESGPSADMTGRKAATSAVRRLRGSPRGPSTEKVTAMKIQNLGLYVLAAAILVVAAMVLDVQASSIWPLVLVAACPLMMIFMMRGMAGGGHGTPDDRPTDEPTDRHTDRDSRGTPR